MPSVKAMTAKQQLFVHEYLKCRQPGEAARRAGYKNPDVMGAQLRNRELYPMVVAEIEQALAKVQAASVLDAVGVQRYIHTAMTFQPLKFFTPSEGGWLLTEEQFRTLPDEIGQLIEDMTVRETVKLGNDGEETRTVQYWVKFVSKTKAMDLAAKHQLGEKRINESKVTIDWTRAAPQSNDDAVEAEILKVEAQALPPAQESTPTPQE